MTSLGRSLVETTAQLLEFDQRDAVLGDLVEAGESAWQSLLGIFGLAVRNHVSVWRSWRPWLAAFGVSLPASFLLMGVSVSISRSWHNQAGVGALLTQLLLLIGWAWSAGYLVGALSRRTVWMSALLCCSPCLFCFARFCVPQLSRFSLFLFLLPAIWGALQGLRGARFSLRATVVAALILTSIAIAGHQSWWLIATLTWPAWYLVALARRTATA